jgi:toxin ParE1/3/4
MAEYKLSQRAADNLVEIYAYTELNFGRYQADAYNAGFDRVFGLLAQFPRMGRDASDLRAGLRRFRFQSHSTFYTEEGDHIFIRAISHHAQNPRPDLFD